MADKTLLCPHCGRYFPIDLEALATIIAKKILDTPISDNPVGTLRKQLSSLDTRNKVLLRYIGADFDEH